MEHEVENLIIYKQYVDLIQYTTMIILKFPKMERESLCRDIKKATYDGLECILHAYRFYDKQEKLHYLIETDVKLKFIKALVRVSYQKKYINMKNYSAWSNKIYHIGNLLGGWIIAWQK